jgi:hypothetical protein
MRYHWLWPRLTISTRQAPSGVCIAYMTLGSTQPTLRPPDQGRYLRKQTTGV